MSNSINNATVNIHEIQSQYILPSENKIMINTIVSGLTFVPKIY